MKVAILFTCLLVSPLCLSNELSLHSTSIAVNKWAANINCENLHDKQHRQAAIEAINEIRRHPQICGQLVYAPASPLSWNNNLEKSALKHARSIASRKWLSHLDGNGFSLRQRLNLSGYNGIGGGENLASGQNNLAKALMNWLTLSTTHCDNLMHAKYQDYAVSCVRDPETRRPYWVQHFGNH